MKFWRRKGVKDSETGGCAITVMRRNSNSMDAEREPTMYSDEPPYNQDVTPDELERIQAAYREIQRRDGAAWYHAKNWRRFALTLLGGLLVSTGVNAYLAKQASRVEVLVQTVQLTEEGTLVQVGVPADLLAYAPSDGEWMNFLAQWIMKRRWRGDEASMTRTKVEWTWLARHTCGQAATQLEQE